MLENREAPPCESPFFRPLDVQAPLGAPGEAPPGGARDAPDLGRGHPSPLVAVTRPPTPRSKNLELWGLDRSRCFFKGCFSPDKGKPRISGPAILSRADSDHTERASFIRPRAELSVVGWSAAQACREPAEIHQRGVLT